MKILLSGGTGYIGSAVLSLLTKAGYEVVTVARSANAVSMLESAAVPVLLHELADRAWLVDQLRHVDGMIHTASGAGMAPGELDNVVIDAAVDAFADTDKPFVHTGGMWTYGNSTSINEESPANPAAVVAWRVEPEQRVLTSGINAALVVPSITYGRGRGIPKLLAEPPHNDRGEALAIGSGSQHMENVYIDDLAALYLAVLRKGRRGERYIATSGVHPTLSEVTTAAVGAKVRVVPEGAEASRLRLGVGFADALMLDQQASNYKARSELDWVPVGPTILTELATGSYTKLARQNATLLEP